MKKNTLVALLILLGVALSLPPAASAVAVDLTNTPLISAPFAGGVALSRLGESIVTGDGGGCLGCTGATATVDSAAYYGTGIAEGLFVYTYQLTVTVGDIFSLFVPFGGPANVVQTLDLDANPGADTSFYITDAALVHPTQTQLSADNATGAFTGFFFGFTTDTFLTAGTTSTIIGLISPAAPGLVIADFTDGGSTANRPLVVAPAPPVPEPGTLLLLGSGLSGLAAWGWRRKRGQ